MNDYGNESIGYLVIKVSTARGAIPLENAAVSVRGKPESSSGILYSLRTDSSGLTPRVSLPTPPKSLSQSPGNPTPFSLWDIDVFCDGFISAHYTSVPVYPDVTSIQNADLTPLPEGFSKGDTYNESSAPNL